MKQIKKHIGKHKWHYGTLLLAFMILFGLIVFVGSSPDTKAENFEPGFFGLFEGNQQNLEVENDFFEEDDQNTGDLEGLLPGLILPENCPPYVEPYFEENYFNTTTLGTEALLEKAITDIQFSINDHAKVTGGTTVSLKMNAVNARQMIISNDPTFKGARWQEYQCNKSWGIEKGNGLKVVYVMFRNEYYSTPVIAETIVLKDEKESNLSKYLDILFQNIRGTKIKF
ncbi:hypothetical protein ACFLZY_03155 [Patescibacteria group bacterium]